MRGLAEPDRLDHEEVTDEGDLQMNIDRTTNIRHRTRIMGILRGLKVGGIYAK